MIRGSVPVYALIPARGGSKGVINKNLKQVGAESLVQRSIRIALDVPEIDRCIVTSDSVAIRQQAMDAGAEVHERSEEASADDATAFDVLEDFLRSETTDLRKDNPFIIYLQPTSPMRTSKHIIEALSLVENSKTTICVSLNRRNLLLQKLIQIDSSSGTIQYFASPSGLNDNRQRLGPNLYLPNGAIYIFRYSDFTTQGAFPLVGGIPYWMDELSSIDIDHEHDLELVNYIEEA